MLGNQRTRMITTAVLDVRGGFLYGEGLPRDPALGSVIRRRFSPFLILWSQSRRAIRIVAAVHSWNSNGSIWTSFCIHGDEIIDTLEFMV